MRSFQFFAAATVALWLAVSLPLSVLFSWLSNSDTARNIVFGFFLTPALAYWVWQSFQTSSLIRKQPAVQLLGAGTILLSVVVACLPLLWLLAKPAVGWIAISFWLLLCLYAFYKANTIYNHPLTITSDKLQSALRIVHLSDIHAGSRSTTFISKVVNQTLQHSPDIVVITGDLLDSSAVDTQFLQPLTQLKCPTYLCIGNHERYVNLEAALNAVSNNQVSVLRNLTASTHGIHIIGIDDADDKAQVANVLPALLTDSNQFQVLLYHRPDGWGDAKQHGIDLQLSGHTHAGQIWPFGYLVKLQFPLLHGHFQANNQHLYVSQGTGTWGPTLRLGTRCEMTVIDLAPANT